MSLIKLTKNLPLVNLSKAIKIINNGHNKIRKKSLYCKKLTNKETSFLIFNFREFLPIKKKCSP